MKLNTIRMIKINYINCMGVIEKNIRVKFKINWSEYMGNKPKI